MRGETRRQRILTLVVLVVPLRMVLTVLMSLGWCVRVVLASVGWIGKRLVRATERVVRTM